MSGYSRVARAWCLAEKQVGASSSISNSCRSRPTRALVVLVGEDQNVENRLIDIPGRTAAVGAYGSGL